MKEHCQTIETPCDWFVIGFSYANSFVISVGVFAGKSFV